jgi:TonB family protein
MKKLFLNLIKNWSLRTSASISLGLHLFMIFSFSILLSEAEVRQTSIRLVKVTLHPLKDNNKFTPKLFSPLSVKNQIQRPEKRDPIQEQEQKEPVIKKEFVPPIPLPVQSAARDTPVEEPKVIFPPWEEVKIEKEFTPVATDVTLEKAFLLKKEENRSVSSVSSPTGVLQGKSLSDTTLGEGAGIGQGIGQGGSPGGTSGNELGVGNRGPHWRVSREGVGLGKGDPRGGGSPKGVGVLSKIFSSPRGAAGNHPRYAENPKPPYPEEALKKGLEGEVLLRVEVLANGRAGQIEVKSSSGHEVLDRSALSAVKQWKFIPAHRGGESIPFWVNIPIKFQLQ